MFVICDYGHQPTNAPMGCVIDADIGSGESSMVDCVVTSIHCELVEEDTEDPLPMVYSIDRACVAFPLMYDMPPTPKGVPP